MVNLSDSVIILIYFIAANSWFKYTMMILFSASTYVTFCGWVKHVAAGSGTRLVTNGYALAIAETNSTGLVC